MSDELRTFLDTLVLTLPLTLHDCVELKRLIKLHAPEAIVDVHSRDGRRMHVTVDSYSRVYDAI